MSMPAVTSTSTTHFVRCPPYCPNTCSTHHHPLLVVLLNCADSEEKPVLNQRLQSLEHVVSTYEQDSEWDVDMKIPDATEAYRYPMVHWACALGRVSALCWLLERGALQENINAENGVSGLHRAINCLPSIISIQREASSKFKRLLFLMEKCLPVQDTLYNTPLHTCGNMLRAMMPKEEFFMDCIKYILEFITMRNDASLKECLTVQNIEGNTILHLICHKDDLHPLVKKVCKLMPRDYLNIANNQDQTPLDIAQTSGQIKIATYLSNLLRTERSSRPGSPESSTSDVEFLEKRPGRRSGKPFIEKDKEATESKVSSSKGILSKESLSRSNSASSQRSVTPPGSSSSPQPSTIVKLAIVSGKRPSTSKYAMNRSPVLAKGSTVSESCGKKRSSPIVLEDDDESAKRLRLVKEPTSPIARLPAETTTSNPEPCGQAERRKSSEDVKNQDTKVSNTAAAPSGSGTPNYFQEGAAFLDYLKGCSNEKKIHLLGVIKEDWEECQCKISELGKSEKELDSKISKLKEGQQATVMEIQRLLDMLNKLQKEEGQMKDEISKLQSVKDHASGSFRLYKERLSHCQSAIHVLSTL